MKLYRNDEITTLNVEDLREKYPHLVLYFYPKDGTPGCTREAHEFSEKIDTFRKMGYEVVGVSTDDIKSHENFAASCNIRFPIVSDKAREAHRIYKTWGLKEMFGKQYEGTIRSTFIVREGHVIHERRNVKIPGHVSEIISTIESESFKIPMRADEFNPYA